MIDLIINNINYSIKVDINILYSHEHASAWQQESPEGIKKNQPVIKYLLLIGDTMEKWHVYDSK
jgi:hypothetical protein